MRRTLLSVNPRKAAGPNGIPVRTLKDLTRIFNQSLCQSTVPSCLKSSIIMPLPKKQTINCLNDCTPVALTPVVMKCFEKLIRQHIMTFIPPSFDTHQFAYRANRSPEDAITTTLHAVLSHFEHQGSYAQMLFVDFSSAFNTILPHRLVNKLLDIRIPHSTCLWIKDFLTQRTQRVRVGPHLSTAISLSTGSPRAVC